MKKLALLLVLAVELACGNPPIKTVVTTNTSGNWEAQLFSNNVPVSDLNFVTSFNITNTTNTTISNEPIEVTGFGFFNSGPCFDTGLTSQNEVGTATLNTNNAGQVTGSFNFTITSKTNGNVLTLTTSPNGALTGVSNGTTSTTGTLSKGVVVGTWTLKSSNSSCANSNSTNTFLMCQGAATCTPPA